MEKLTIWDASFTHNHRLTRRERKRNSIVQQKLSNDTPTTLANIVFTFYKYVMRSKYILYRLCKNFYAVCKV